MYKILSIAGSDSSSIAGIQSDHRTSINHNIYCATCITALTAQNSSKISAIKQCDPEFFEQQLKIILYDVKFDAIKIGMIPNELIADIIYRYLSKFKIKIIFDPIIKSSSNTILANKKAISSFINKIIKISYLITPNIDEASKLTNHNITSISDIKRVAIQLRDLGANNILIKGGHLLNSKTQISNILYDKNNNFYEIKNKRLEKNFRGTGCALSTAITCNIAMGYDIYNSIKRGNSYVYKTAKKSIKIGEGKNILGYL